MKKILSVLAICLVLTLCAGMALAASDSGYSGWSYEYPTRIHDGALNPDKVDEEKSTYATCTENGIVFYWCSFPDTGELFHEVVWYAFGHSFDEKNGFDPKTYPEEFTKVIDCNTTRYYCRHYNMRTKAQCTAYIDLPADNHVWSSDDPTQKENWGKIIEEPTCYSTGRAIDYCINCGLEREKERVIDKIPHKFVKVLDVEPECVPDSKAEKIADGLYHYACSVCGEINTNPVEPHDADGYIKITYQDYMADAAFKKAADYDGHDWDGWIFEKEPQCAYPQEGVRFCKRCGSKQLTKVNVPHNYEIVKTLKDCYTARYTKVCQNIVVDPVTGVERVCGEADPAFVPYDEAVVAHQYVEDKAHEVDRVDPTCENDGYVVYKCIHILDAGHVDYSRDLSADDLYKGGYKKVILPKLGHAMGDWVLRYEIGEGENEYAYYVRTCTRCPATEEKVTLYTPEECAEGEHEWTAIGFELPECGIPGTVWYKCFVCGAEKEEETPALEHEFEEELVKAATCTENGKILKTCKVCGYMETEEIEAEGHDWVDQGDGTSKCSVCGEVKGDAWKEGFVVEDGVWKWYVHDVWQKDLTAIVTFDGAEFWVVNGVLPLDANGLINCPDGKFYFLSQGKIVRNTGFVEYLGQWFKIVNGELDLTYNGLCDYDGGKFLVAAGRWIQTVSGLWQNLDSKWYYLADGQVVAYSGVAEYNGRFFVVANGVLDTSYNGTIKYDGHTFEVVNGQLAEVPID